MRQVTLCFLLDDEKILLAMKKRGFGSGKVNGAGGKVAETETVKEAALRELHEEIGVTTKEEDLLSVGSIAFFHEGRPQWNREMHVFFIRSWSGEPVESEEMAPMWFPLHALPLEKMWVSDAYWLPRALAGEKIHARCYFNESGEVEKFEFE